MSNTFTGVVDPALSLIGQNAQVFPNDRQGTLVELSAAGELQLIISFI